MATINTGPAAVNTGATTTTLGPLDRAPAPVSSAVDPQVPPPTPVFNRPVDRAPDPVAPGPGLGISSATATVASIPVTELPVDTANQTSSGGGTQTGTPIYIKVLSDGTVVTSPTTVLNFLGAGVSVTANGTQANITITGSDYSNSNVISLLGAFGSNPISTTGNITGGNMLANGSMSITGNLTVNGNATLSGNILGDRVQNGTTSFDIQTQNGNANITVAGTSNVVVFTTTGVLVTGLITASGNITGGNVLTGGAVSATGNVAGNYFIGNGSQLSGLSTSSISNGTSNVRIATANGNVTIAANASSTWTFDATGNLTLPANGDLNFNNGGIAQSAGDDFDLQSFNGDGVVSSSLSMRPGDPSMRLEQWSGQDSNSWTTSDWATGVYTTQGGGSIGAVEFTGAATIIDFVNSLTGTGQIYFSVNGGPQLAWDGTSSGATNITFYTATLPATDPTTVTSFDYYYSYKSGFEIDYDVQEVNIYANDADINLETTNQRDITLNSSRDMTLSGNGAYSLTNYSTADAIIIASNASGTLHQWAFDTVGNLTLPNVANVSINYANGQPYGGTGSNPNTGNVTFSDQIIIGTGSNDGGGGLYLAPGPASIANSAVQYLRVRGGDYPTHIHLDTGNNLYYDQYFGDDGKYVKIEGTGNIVINPQQDGGPSAQWTFGYDGNLTLPNDSNIAIVGNITQFNTGANGFLGLNSYDAGGNNIARVGISSIDGLVGIGTYDPATDSDYSWNFDNTGNLTVPGNILSSGNILIAPDSASPSAYLDIYLTGGPDIHIAANDQRIIIGRDTGANVQVGNDGNVSIKADSGPAQYIWNFDDTGNLTVPGNTVVSTAYATGGAAGNSITIQAGAAGTGVFNTNPGGDLNLVGGLGGFNDDGTGGPGGNINITAGLPGEPGNHSGNVTINTGSANTWTFDYTGDLTLPAINLGSGLDEQTTIQSQRKIIPPFRYSAVIDGTTPTVVYTATDVNTTSMKVTMQIQHTGLGFEFFEVFATYTGSVDTWYTVTNRVAPPTIDASTVVVDLNGSNTMQITVTIESGAATSWVTYDAVEFGIPVD